MIELIVKILNTEISILEAIIVYVVIMGTVLVFLVVIPWIRLRKEMDRLAENAKEMEKMAKDLDLL